MKTVVSAAVRWMIRRDMDCVLATEHSLRDGWTEQDFLDALRQRKCIGMVAELGERAIGHMVYDLHKNRLELLNIAVNPDWQRAGVGTLLIEKLKSKLSPERRQRIVTSVPDWNLPAQLFLRSQGFRCVSVIRGDEDLYRFVYRLA